MSSLHTPLGLNLRSSLFRLLPSYLLLSNVFLG
ncbi:hypothetical protein CIPAW_02G104700 [Carya illinoinensis]|uniref:Uncharacterized protein n=1 Tax=Carya illinoinensis TaxID=32201 RepID=A0A8T1REX8_CARIL|nr:hypothetical protein CIPAW_02G104700 [Carya illinoinensis]